jgi:hypothetical protein
VYFASPTSTFGYYRGTPYTGGTGSGMGQAVNGVGILPQGQGANQDTGWTPTILYLFVLIIAEMVIFGFIGRHI